MNINLSPTKEKYYSQLNNELDPYIACQVTTMIMGLDIAGFSLDPLYRIPNCIHSQPEDRLRWFMLNNEDVQNFWKKSHPQTNTPAPEWADCMVYAVNKLYEKDIVRYENNLTKNIIYDDLSIGMPIYTSMKYPNNRNLSGALSPIPGHIVLVVGVINDRIIVNDPYKNHLTGDKNGWNNVYLPEDWQKYNKGYGIRYRKI